MNRILTLLVREPALATGVTLAVIGVLASFGLGLTDGQTDAVVALVASVLSVVGAVVTRTQVSPKRR